MPRAVKNLVMTAGVLGFAVSITAACTGTSGPSRTAAPPRPRPGVTAGPAVTLRVTPAPYQLPAGIAREVTVSKQGTVLIVGGLTTGGTTSAVTTLNPVTGRTTAAPRLSVATHDAAGAVLGGQVYVFGGGSAGSVSVVQRLGGASAARIVGHLRQPWSDLSAASIGGMAYLAGGYDGAVYATQVMATRDGVH